MSQRALSAWQDVVTYHPHLRDNSADYAIHLGDVLRDAAHCPLLYRDAAHFFQATFPAQPLLQLISEVNQRLEGNDGPRVLRLQSGFGGGKSHALLALYHWCHAPHKVQAQTGWEVLPTPPETRLVALSGLDFDPQTGIALPDGPICRTIWGAIAWQLGGQRAWSTWATHDRECTAPGGAMLQQLLQTHPTLLLLDELLLYIEKTQAIALGDSTFGKQNLLFLQTLTEVIRTLPRAAMVYTLQATAAEAAGDQTLLDTLAHLSHRLEAQRQPLQPSELLQVLRRRLFADLGDIAHHEAAADAHITMWQRYDNTHKRRDKAHRDPHLRQALIDGYPFHPALIDLLTQQWWDIPTYQRTRGALQLLSQALQTTLPPQALLAPGALPIATAWRQRLWAQLGASPKYEDLLEYELLAPESASQQAAYMGLSAQAQAELPAAAQLTHRSLQERYLTTAQLTTTLLLFSFGGKGATARGLLAHDNCRICLQPDQHPMHVDVSWQHLREKLGFLHERSSRFRLDTSPNLQYQLAQEHSRWSQQDIEASLFSLLKRLLSPLHEAQLWPSEPQEIPDRTPSLQLVYLDLSWRQRALATSQSLLRSWIEQRTTRRPRQYRNGIVLLQPSAARWPVLADALRETLSLQAMADDPTHPHHNSSHRKQRQQQIEQALPLLALQLYHTAWVPQHQPGEAGGYQLEHIDLSTWMPSPEAPSQHILDALHQQFRLSLALTPEKLAQLAASLAPAPTPESPATISFKVLQDAFFCYLHFPRIPSLAAIIPALEELQRAGWRIDGPLPAKVQRSHPPDSWNEQVIISLPPPATKQTQEPTTDSALGTSQRPEAPTSRHQMTLAMQVTHSQLSSLAALLRQIERQADTCQIKLEVAMQSEQAPPPRWVAVTLKDTLEELGIDYDLKLSSQSGASMPCAASSKPKS